VVRRVDQRRRNRSGSLPSGPLVLQQVKEATPLEQAVSSVLLV
jgi:hypothetical protein